MQALHELHIMSSVGGGGHSERTYHFFKMNNGQFIHQSDERTKLRQNNDRNNVGTF